jgi:4-hydroxybenzoate polyprenyltransferase
MIVPLIKSMRPPQWAKNGIVFAPLIFSKHFYYIEDVLMTAVVFSAFCLIASSIYIFNDLRDIEADRLHPTKKKRPLASGQLPASVAQLAMLLIAASGLAILSFSGTQALACGITYLVLNLLYTLILKKIVILDVMSIAAGFVLRIFAGGLAIDVEVSYWLILCTVLLALFMGFGKRRHELVLLDNSKEGHRAILREYSTYFLDQMMSVVTSSTVVCYSLYTLDPGVRQNLGTEYLPLTIPFVLYGIFRYLYLIHQREQGGSPTRILFTDRPLLADIILWIVTVFIILAIAHNQV